eukprot:361232-Chlamydomonas_euryale.AAC.2
MPNTHGVSRWQMQTEQRGQGGRVEENPKKRISCRHTSFGGLSLCGGKHPRSRAAPAPASALLPLASCCPFLLPLPSCCPFRPVAPSCCSFRPVAPSVLLPLPVAPCVCFVIVMHSPC